MSPLGRSRRRRALVGSGPALPIPTSTGKGIPATAGGPGAFCTETSTSALAAAAARAVDAPTARPASTIATLLNIRTSRPPVEPTLTLHLQLVKPGRGGWRTGLEPATTGTTTRGSTELSYRHREQHRIPASVRGLSPPEPPASGSSGRRGDHPSRGRRSRRRSSSFRRRAAATRPAPRPSGPRRGSSSSTRS